jgi:hypothetical protein
MDLQMGCGGMDPIAVAHDREKWWALIDARKNFRDP